MNDGVSDIHWLAGSVLMVRPLRFGFNPETADSNSFQHHPESEEVHAQAMAEFDGLVSLLRSNGIQVVVAQSSDPLTPDAIFPNNWFSTHADGSLLLYPMMAPNRRRERSVEMVDLLNSILPDAHLADFSSEELKGNYLEGTGSIVFDHKNKVAYAALSPRTDAGLLEKVAAKLGYTPITFHCTDPSGKPVYHTNVVLHIGPGYALIYVDGITDHTERSRVLDSLQEGGLRIITIDQQQLINFCGNLLALQNADNIPCIVCSSTAWKSFSVEQRQILSAYGRILIAEIPVIEKTGGGGVRCMLAELFTKEEGR
jgi:hypothetical protein